MACIGSDGKPTASGIKVLHALNAGINTAEGIAKNTSLPLFRVRSGVRQMVEAGLVSQNDDAYAITGKGKLLV
jgi:predicted transcriptional regulator